MPVPVDPYNFVNGTIADGDQVDLRFKRLYDALNPAVQGIDATNLADGAVTAGKLANGSVSATKLTALEAWTNLTLLNSWQDAAVGGYTVAVRKDLQGRVYVRGTVKNITANRTNPGLPIFQLPAGYRPAATVRLPAASWDGTVQTSGVVIIGADGNVNTDGTNGFGWLTLDQISFATG